jgi:hypothetical protein
MPNNIKTIERGIQINCLCGCRYGVERSERDARTGRRISVARWCQDCGEETEEERW